MLNKNRGFANSNGGHMNMLNNSLVWAGSIMVINGCLAVATYYITANAHPLVSLISNLLLPIVAPTIVGFVYSALSQQRITSGLQTGIATITIVLSLAVFVFNFIASGLIDHIGSLNTHWGIGALLIALPIMSIVLFIIYLMTHYGLTIGSRLFFYASGK
jgi:uncharacterized membrane-anchored protein